MKALVYHGPGAKSWEDVPDAEVQDPTDVVVRVDTTTICGTDLHILQGDVPAVTDGRILGHEAVGTVVEVGDGVQTLAPGDRVLEIGTGWGSLAMEACRQVPGITVDSLTLSKEQKVLAEERIKEAGLESQITVHLMDYRDMPATWDGTFDRVVSIEMLEAVGIEFLSTYFSNVNRVLRPDVGTAVFQCITMPEARFDAYVRGVDFIKKYIFPGGVLPSVRSLVDAMADGSKGTMVLQAVDSIGPHYARTLREWHQRFEAAFDDGESGIRAALLRDSAAIRALPEAQREAEVEVFRRKWIYYFVYCERGFAENQIGGECVRVCEMRIVLTFLLRLQTISLRSLA